MKSLVAKPWLKVEQARPLVSSVGIRGISAGQGASCGFGMRGQKSRSGPAVTIGFEGGQMPLYRRIPKLRGIAGGNLISQHSLSFLYPIVLIPTHFNILSLVLLHESWM